MTVVTTWLYLVGPLADDLEPPRAHGGPRRFGKPAVPCEDVREAPPPEHPQRFAQAEQQVGRRRVGKKPFAFEASIGSHAQYDRGSARRRDAASAFSLMALKLRPGGSIRPFCDPDSVTSILQSS